MTDDPKKTCFDCDHCGMDMDMTPYCVAPPVVREHPHGLNTNQALEKYCGFDARTLFVTRRPR